MADFDVELSPFREALLGRSLSQMSNTPLRTLVRAPWKLGQLSVAPDATLEIQVLNRADDRDSDGVFGPKEHIAFDTQRAWLKYKITGALAAKLAAAPLSAALTDRVELVDYRVHTPVDDALRAMSDDIASPRSILSLDDVRRLEPGEALALERGGRFTTALTVGWADVLTTMLSEILEGFTAAPVSVRVSRALEAAVVLEVDDQFAIVISRALDGRLRLTAKRGASRDHRFGVDAELGVTASAVKGIEDAIGPLFEALTSVSIEAAERAARKFEVEPLSTEERDILDRLAAFFGVDSAEERAAAIRRGVAGVKRELRVRLEKALAWKAVAAFRWQYARSEEETTLADFILEDESLLPHDHARMIAGDFAAIAHALRRDSGRRTILEYLDQDVRERKESGGFTLSFGKWRAIATEDTSKFRLQTRESLSGFRLVETRATRAYEEKGLAQNDFEWAVDFRGAMDEYAERPDTSMLQYRLQYAVKLERTVLREDDIARMLDFAAMWGVAVPSPSTYASALGKRAALQLQILFDDVALEAAVSSVTPDLDVWAPPLAGAMPWSGTFEERRSFASRHAVYEDAWRAWLAGAPPVSLRTRIRSGLAVFEDRRLPGSFVWTTNDGHPHLRSRLARFVHGCRQLYGAMNDARPCEDLEGIAADLEQLWSQRLYVAASGRFLLDRADEAGAKVRRTLRVEVEDEVVVS